MDKRIITWQWGNNPTHDEHTTSRAFIFDNYGDNFAHYARVVEEAKRDFPDLKDEDITIGKVSVSPYMKHFIMITFLVADNLQREGYRSTSKFDFEWQ